MKLQEYMKSKERGVINVHDVYQKNFITTINDLEKELEQKETKMTNIMKNIKSFEKENVGIKKENNFHLNNELDQALYDKR